MIKRTLSNRSAHSEIIDTSIETVRATLLQSATSESLMDLPWPAGRSGARQDCVLHCPWCPMIAAIEKGSPLQQLFVRNVPGARADAIAV